jgi:DNA-directed RNA polymerase specialized sigma24 family protein
VISAMTAAARPDPTQEVDIWAPMQELPARLRNALAPHYYAGLTLLEAAAILGWPEGTVTADRPRARGQLKTAVREDHD